MFRNLFFLHLLFFLLLAVSPARAVTVAVLPVEDLSQGRNGVNSELTDFLQQNLQERGLDIVPTSTMISFLAKKRIRWLGYLDSSHVFQMRDDLNVDYILIGTVSQRQDNPVAALGMILNLVQANDGRTVWSQSGGLSCADICNFLSLAEPQTIDDLLPVLADKLMGTWPDDLSLSEADSPRLVVESTLLEPRYVRAGEEISCTVQLRPFSGQDEIKQVQLMIGDDDYLTMNEEMTNVFSASWLAPDRGGSIPVSLILKEKSGRKHVFFVGNYQVDNSAPKLILKPKGTELFNTIAFSDKLPVVPLWQDPEPISRWLFTIKNVNDEVMVSGEGKGKLPKRFLWWGQRGDGHKAADGVYTVLLKVWDRAGNETATTRKVMLHAQPPILKIDAKMAIETIVLTVKSDDDIPISSWSAEILYSDGQTIIMEQGTELPVELDIPIPAEDDNRKVECLFIIKDILGNRGKREIRDIMELISPDDLHMDIPKDDEWVVEF